MLVQAHCFPNAFRPCWAVPWYWSWASRRKWKKCWGTQWPSVAQVIASTISAIKITGGTTAINQPGWFFPSGVDIWWNLDSMGRWTKNQGLWKFENAGLTSDEIWIEYGRWTKRIVSGKKRESGLGRCKTSIEDWERVAVWIGLWGLRSKGPICHSILHDWPVVFRGFPAIRQSFASPHTNVLLL